MLRYEGEEKKEKAEMNITCKIRWYRIVCQTYHSTPSSSYNESELVQNSGKIKTWEQTS